MPVANGTASCALVVDDDRAVAGVLGAFLERLGMVVTVANGHEEGERQLAEGRGWSLVVTDLQLTGGNRSEGLSLLREARRRYPQARIILVSGSQGRNLQAIAEEHGADQFLAKPVSFATLRACVEPWLGENADGRGKTT